MRSRRASLLPRSEPGARRPPERSPSARFRDGSCTRSSPSPKARAKFPPDGRLTRYSRDALGPLFGENRDPVAEEPSTHDVARPVFGEVDARQSHRENYRDGDIDGPAQHRDQEREARHVAARERERSRRLEEREQRNAPRELTGRRRLRDRELQRELSGENDRDHEGHPPIAALSPQP